MMSMQVEKPRTPRSLTTTLAIAFLALSVATLLIANVSQIPFYGRAIQESVDSQQRLAAQEAANTVASFIQEKFSILETAARIGEPTSTSQEEQESVLGNLLGLELAFRQLVLLDAQEQELAAVSRLSRAASGQLTDRAESELSTRVRQGNRYISSVYVDDVTSEPLVIMAVPATDAFGDFQGLLLAEVNLKFMWDLVGRLEVGEMGLAYVVDKQGNLIAFGDISRVLRGENVSHLDMVGEFIRNPVPVGEAATRLAQGINGTTVVGTCVPLGVPDWAVVTELPMAEALRPGIQSTVLAVLVILVAATLVGLVGTYIARRLAAPLLNLTATAGRIAGGETDLQAAMEGPAEVVDLAQAFNSMTAQLRELIGSLEQRVADRTRNLRAAAEVARATTSVLNPDELLRQTVDLVRERFDLYYVGLFLLDEERRFAVLRAGTGEAGQKMLARGHRLGVGGDSMIGQCVAKAEARIALDVGEEAVRFDNPLLPETRSELALPLRSRGQVIGAMTVQSVEEAAFDEADIAVMQTMADQVAVAIDNARLFTESQAALEAERRAYGELSWQAWSELLRARTDWGYRYASQSVTLVVGDWRPEMRQAERTGQSVQNLERAEGGDGMGGPTLALPIQVRGQVVGVLDFRKDESGERWTDEEIALLETLTDQLSVALESARLYQETQRRAARERLTREITDKMRRASSVEDIVQSAVDELHKALGTSRTFVRLGVLSPQDDGSAESA
jgi:GAF domain-containing protein/HAMP domain-containing protein